MKRRGENSVNLSGGKAERKRKRLRSNTKTWICEASCVATGKKDAAKIKALWWGGEKKYG